VPFGPEFPFDSALAIFGIFFLPFITIGFVVWLIVRARSRRKAWEHEEKMAMVGKGGYTPPEPVSQVEKTYNLDKTLLAGIIIAAIGVMWIFHSFSFLLILLGLGLIGLYFVPRKREISQRGRDRFFISGVIIASIGAMGHFESFGLFLLLLGSGLVGFYFLSRRGEPQSQSSELQGSVESTEEKQPGQEGQEE